MYWLNYTHKKMKIIIFGASGQAKETIDFIEENIKGQIVGLINIEPFKSPILGHEFLGMDSEIDQIIKRHKPTHFFVAIGDPVIRGRIYLAVRQKLQPLSIFSKRAYVSKYTTFGEHVIVYPGVVINADVSVGDNVLINSNAAIGHEVKIGNHVNINPGANIAGKVTIGDYSTIGIGASIKEKIVIASGTLVGAGAAVVKNTKPNKIYVGVPAKILKK